MQVINSDSFYFGGILIFIDISLNVLSLILLRSYKPSSFTFSIFTHPFFRLNKFNLWNKEFILGWLPIGSNILPLFAEDSSGELSLTKEKKFGNLSLIYRYLFYVIILICSIYFNNGNQNFLLSVQKSIDYLLKLYFEIFKFKSGNIEYFIDYSIKFLNKKSVVLFSIMIYSSFWLIEFPLITFFNLLDKKVNKTNVYKYFEFIIIHPLRILLFIVHIWKIPIFIFTLFSVSEILTSSFSFLLGSFIVGCLFYVFIIYVYKNLIKWIFMNPK